jgi:hypothetical protein
MSNKVSIDWKQILLAHFWDHSVDLHFTDAEQVEATQPHMPGYLISVGVGKGIRQQKPSSSIVIYSRVFSIV